MPTAERYHQYEILRREDGSLWELGRGATGITYKAYDTNLGFTVALKVINPAFLESDTARQRFLREARAGAALRHPNVASVFNLGTDQGNYFYVMEFIDGETVEACVRRKGPLDPVETLNIGLQVTLVLAVAAKQQLVHRDLKPTHLMLVDQQGESSIKVIDFGLAKVPKDAGEDSGALTMEGFVGTPHFASPEQVEEGEVDNRSDIYSLGATLYFMLTGQSPFSGSVGQIMRQQMYKPLPITRLAHVPRCIVFLLQHMMEKDPNKRPQTPQDLQRDIFACLEEIRASSDRSVRNTGESTSAFETLDLTPVLENVQFSVYRPREIQPRRWYKMLIFTHLDERPEWLDATEASPLEEVEKEAQRILGPRLETYRKTTNDSRFAVPREDEITFVPKMQGIQFNPPTRSFSWKDGLSVHLETFELIAGAFGPDVRRPDITRGQVTVFLGHLILAEIAISIRISEPRGAGTLARETPESSSVHRFRKIFASYSHKDLEIVKEMERYSVSLGDRYLRDWVDLRAGERWDERLLGMITEADIFQLFWSWNSSQSPYVAREWRHAFSLSRETFIRPTYWEDPWPRPPEPLLRFQFQRLEIAMLRDRECEIRPAVLERCDKTAATPDSFSEISESVARSRFGGRRFILIALVLGVMLLLAYIAGVFTLPLIEWVRGALHF